MPVYSAESYETVGFPEVGESILWWVRRGPTLTDGVGFYVANILAQGIIGRVVSAADSLSASDSLTKHFQASRTVAEVLALSETVGSFTQYKPTVADVIGVVDPVSLGYVRTLSETVGIEPQHVVARAMTVLDGFGLSPSHVARMMYKMTVAEAARFLDGLFNFFAADIVESLGIQADESVYRLAAAQAFDQVDIDETADRSLVLRITAPDTIDIDDIPLSQMFFNTELNDLIDIMAAYVAPNDSFTVWNVNAITGSVARYDNYAFNSFAHFGQMYLGADENGLYELNGCNDEGSAIIARIKSGLAQLTASRFTMVRDAYVGMRSDGTFILRVTTGEGQTYDYRFDTESMKTTRVQLGKGMRTRYLSFELISVGDDFDLESVEFIPLMSNRRV